MNQFDPRARLRLSPRGSYGTEMDEGAKRRLIGMGVIVGVLALVALIVWWPSGGPPTTVAPPTAGQSVVGQLKEALMAAGSGPGGEWKFAGIRWEEPKMQDGKEIITINGAVPDKAALEELNTIVKRFTADPKVVIDTRAVTSATK